MRHLSNAEVADWLASQRWLTLRDPRGVRFDVIDSSGLTKYEAEITTDSASVGCDMAGLFLHDVTPEDFHGGIFWIACLVGHWEAPWRLMKQVLRAGGLTMQEQFPEFLLLEPADYEVCFALVALTLTFGWDANLVLTGRRFLLTIDDEPFPALITDRASEWFIEAAKNLDFKVSPLGNPAAGSPDAA